MRVTIEKKTDQLNYEDFLGGITRVVTVAGVKAGTKEQQYNIASRATSGCGAPVDRATLLAAAWGDDSTEWAGRRAPCTPTTISSVGTEMVEGSRVSHLATRRRAARSRSRRPGASRKMHYPVQPLVERHPAPAFDVATCTDQDQLRAAWVTATPDVKATIEARVAELKAASDERVETKQSLLNLREAQIAVVAQTTSDHARESRRADDALRKSQHAYDRMTGANVRLDQIDAALDALGWKAAE